MIDAAGKTTDLIGVTSLSANDDSFGALRLAA